jgi:ABC-type transport system substrate-binding protein
LTLQIGQNQRSAAIAEAVQEQWKSIGVNAVIKQVDFPQHLSMVRNAELPLWRTSWIGDYPDAENFFSLFYTNNIAPKGPNTTRYSNPRADSLYRMALSPLLTEKERFTLYHQLEQMIVNDAPWVFIFHSLNQRLAHSYLYGLTVDGLDTKLVLKTVRKSHSADIQ